MKKIIHFLFLLFISLTYSQSVTTTPVIPTASDVITITFDATGSELDGYTGDVYAHTGVITTNSTSNSDWKHVIGAWGNNGTQPQLTRLGANSYQLIITPDIATYYSSGADVITDIAIVFRNSAGNAQSRPDIFIPIYTAGLNIAFTNPTNETILNLNDNISISATSSIAADLELKVNNASIQTALNSTTISKSHTFTTPGNHDIKAIAVENGETKEDNISVYVKGATQNETRPSGLKNGFNDNGDGTVTFVLLAPLKSDVFLIGSFNSWNLDANYQMKKDGDTFWLTVNGLDPDTEYAYQYFIDAGIKIADPYSTKIIDPDDDQYIPSTTYPNLMAYPTGETTGNISAFKINETNYTWQSGSFTRPDKENLIIYEILIRDFTDSDTYQEAITHLDYLQNLGVTAIELMPVNEFEGNDSWGYNPSFYMALDKAYGTSNDLKEFVDACHQRGIAVITDVVFNHSYSESPLAQMYWDGVNNRPTSDSPFYNQNHNLVDNTSAHWGSDFNHESTHTVNFFNDVLNFWMDEYRIDGFRFDFTKGFSNTIYSGANNWASAYDANRIANLKAFADHVWSHDPGNEAYVIFEHLSDNSEETELANYGIMLWGNMNNNFNQNTMGYASNSDVSWLSYKNRSWNNPHIVGYMESHDEERLMVKNLTYGNSNGGYNVKDLNTALDRQEAATAIFYSIPGPKMIWQFGELGYDKSINCDGDIENGSCRLDRKPDAWTLGYDSNSDRTDLYNVTAKMISLKKQFPSTFNTDDYNLNVSGLVKRINLYDNVGSLDAVIIANFDVTTQAVNPNFPATGNWYESFTGSTLNVTNPTASISLQAGEYRLYSQTQSLSTPDLEKSNLASVYPNPANTTFSINQNVNDVMLYSITGQLVKVFKGPFNKGSLFNISSLPKGLYLVKTENDMKEKQTIKLVKL